MNPMLHMTTLRKSITFAYVHLRGNMSKLGLDQWFPKCVGSPPWGYFQGQGARKTKGGENAQPLIDHAYYYD